MDKIYKINNLSFNDKKSQFCLCYNNGIKNFSNEDFKEKYSSNMIGPISLAVLLHDLNMVAFVGSRENEEFGNKKVVIYDLIAKKEIYSTSFTEEIISLKSVNQFLVIGFQCKLNVFSIEKIDSLLLVKEIILPESNIYEIWDKSYKDISSLTTINLIYPFGKDLCISSYVQNDWVLTKKHDITCPTKELQNIFYLEKLNMIIVPDENAICIYGISLETDKQEFCLKRGNFSGRITSITLLNKKYIAVNNLNHTIHIFDITQNCNNNIFSYIGGFFYGNYITPIIQIDYKQLTEEKDGNNFEPEFLKYGAILSSKDDEADLNIIAYNGFAYKLKINFYKKGYELLLKENLTEEKEDKNDIKLLEESEFIYH